MAYFEVTHREQIQSLLPLLISFQISLATLYGFKLPSRLKEKHVWESVYSSWVKEVGDCIDTLTFYHDLSLHQPYGIWCHSIAIASNRFRTVWTNICNRINFAHSLLVSLLDTDKRIVEGTLILEHLAAPHKPLWCRQLSLSRACHPCWGKPLPPHPGPVLRAIFDFHSAQLLSQPLVD